MERETSQWWCYDNALGAWVEYGDEGVCNELSGDAVSGDNYRPLSP